MTDELKLSHRNTWIDLFRLVAIWGVICIHVRGQFYYEVPKNSIEYAIIFAEGYIFIWAVPFFFWSAEHLNYKKNKFKKDIYGENAEDDYC